ncbi:MAG: DM13 domain-containing protein [Cytophagaceae bacterium]|nr:DM13 domain-containing protein [Cytophagaceae bacterium]
MKKLFMITLMACITTFVTASCKKKEDLGPTTTVMSPPPSAESDTIGGGTFSSYDHGLSGASVLYKEGNPEVKKLRLYNFNMTAGPDVHVYLSKTSSYSAGNVIEITKLTTGYTNSSITFDVTSANYSADYKYVLVYCVQYSSLFGYTELT